MDVGTVRASAETGGVTVAFEITNYRVRFDAIGPITEAEFNDDAFDGRTTALSLTLSVSATGPGGSARQTYTGTPQPDGSIDVFIGSFDGTPINETLSFNEPGSAGATDLNVVLTNSPTYNVIRTPDEANNHAEVTSADNTVDYTDEVLTANIDEYIAYDTANNLPGTPTAMNYQWYKDGVAISGETSQTYTPTEAGEYHVVVDVRVSIGGQNYDIEIPSRTFMLSLPSQGSVEAHDIPADDMPLMADEPLADSAGLDIV